MYQPFSIGILATCNLLEAKSEEVLYCWKHAICVAILWHFNDQHSEDNHE